MKMAVCGNDCEKCPRYTATLSKRPEELEKVRLMWIQAGWRDESVDINELLCSGCSDSNFCRYGVVACASARGVVNCGRCDDYPCYRIEAMLEQSVQNASKCRQFLDDEAYEILQAAFFEKVQNLNRERRVKGD